MNKSYAEIIETVMATHTSAELTETTKLKKTATSKMEVRVTGGSDMERLHVALAIEDALVGGRHFQNAKFEFEGIDKEQIPAKVLQWGEVYSKLNYVMRTGPIAIRALRDIDEKNIIDRAIYASEPVDQLVTQLKDTTKFLETMAPLYGNPLATSLIEQNSELIKTIESDGLCAHTEV